MTTKMSEGKVEVLWDDGEFILSRVSHPGDRGTTLSVRLTTQSTLAATSTELARGSPLEKA